MMKKEEWGLLPLPAVVHEAREVDSADVVSPSPPRTVIRFLPQFQSVHGQFEGSFSSAILRMSPALFQSWI